MKTINSLAQLNMIRYYYFDWHPTVFPLIGFSQGKRPMKGISLYRFGYMVIDNTAVTDDCIICSDGIITPWRRKKGHLLDIDDFPCGMLDRCTHLIVGTGCYGMMSVGASVLDCCTGKGISINIMRTPQAVERFNDCADEKNLVGAFHLSC